MPKLLLTLLLLSSTLLIQCQNTTKTNKKQKTMSTLDGVYALRGIQDMAAAFKFTPDGRFEFFYAYGAGDRNATGTYTVEGDTVKLKSDKEPGKDFKIDAQRKQGKGYTIKLNDADKNYLSYMSCFYFVGDKQELAEANKEGIIHIDLPEVDSLYVRHELAVDIPTLVKDKDNDNNYFEVSLLPSLGQVSFKGIDLFIKEDTLTCHPNYFMPFENIRFEKE
jgi:hypothetical protein